MTQARHQRPEIRPTKTKIATQRAWPIVRTMECRDRKVLHLGEQMRRANTLMRYLMITWTWSMVRITTWRDKEGRTSGQLRVMGSMAASKNSLNCHPRWVLHRMMTLWTGEAPGSCVTSPATWWGSIGQWLRNQRLISTRKGHSMTWTSIAVMVRILSFRLSKWIRKISNALQSCDLYSGWPIIYSAVASVLDKCRDEIGV